MTEPPKDKRAAALERIKQLSDKRSSSNAEPQHSKDGAGGGPRKGAEKHGGGPGHRPQGG
jgi:hypothetical protein